MAEHSTSTPDEHHDVPRCEYHSYVFSVSSTSDRNFGIFGVPRISQVLEALSDAIPWGDQGILSLLDTKNHRGKTKILWRKTRSFPHLHMLLSREYDVMLTWENLHFDISFTLQTHIKIHYQSPYCL